MGEDSKIERYHAAGEEPNINTIEEFGKPDHSLYATRKNLTKNPYIEVTDEAGEVLYKSESTVSLLDKTDIMNKSGDVIAHFERKKYSIRERHILTMVESGMEILLEKETFHLIKEITNIKQLEWQLRGNIQRLNFEIFDKDKNIVAVISQKVFAKHDKYSIDIYQSESEDVIASILIILIHIVRDRNIVNSKSITKMVGKVK